MYIPATMNIIIVAVGTHLPCKFYSLRLVCVIVMQM